MLTVYFLAALHPLQAELPRTLLRDRPLIAGQEVRGIPTTLIFDVLPNHFRPPTPSIALYDGPLIAA